MPETIIASVLSGSLEAQAVIQWLTDDLNQEPSEDSVLSCCSKIEFVAHFVTFLRNQIDGILQTSSCTQLQQPSTPSDILVTSRLHHRSISDPTFEVTEDAKQNRSPSKEKKQKTRKVKTKLFSDEKSRESVSSDESRLSVGVDRLALSSTPIKNGVNASLTNVSLMSPVTPVSKNHERCDTPRLTHRHSRSQEKSCLGDYLVSAQKVKKKRNSKNVSDDSDVKVLDLSNSDMFPEIGARKSNSLRAEKKRIKPTNIDQNKKSLSLNSFNLDNFQQPSALALEENVLFKQQKLQPTELSQSFDTERNILKQERQKLMEKFSMSTPKTPQIKIMQRDEKLQNFVEADVNKVVFKEKIDLLVDIYECLLKNNLVLSINAEVNFLISILLSRQYEDDYLDVESKLSESTLHCYLLRTIHNSTYFAVRSLWHERGLLKLILDKNSLKLLGENKKVRSFSGELAKCLLNCYGVYSEATGPSGSSWGPSRVQGGHVVVFNAETDCADNFPSTLTFHNFKKQRDMFYEIVRWYSESAAAGAVPRVGSGVGVGTGVGVGVGLRPRVKALLSAGPHSANMAHLAALFVSHLVSHSQHSQEDRLSKLARRLTQPTPANDPTQDRLFDANEQLYKEMLCCCEHASFRAHVCDALSTELLALDATTVHGDTSQGDLELRSEYLQVIRTSIVAAKFLALTLALPYANVTTCNANVNASKLNSAEKVMENAIAIRKYYRPPLDLSSLLTKARRSGRLSVTVIWLTRYLTVLTVHDPTALRLPYYTTLIRQLVGIYRMVGGEDTPTSGGGGANTSSSNFFPSTPPSNSTSSKSVQPPAMSQSARIAIRLSLGALFAMNSFPQGLFYEALAEEMVDPGVEPDHDNWSSSVDAALTLSPYELNVACPLGREVSATLVASCRGLSQRATDARDRPRHVTPLRIGATADNRHRREHEIQSRLECEFLRSLPSSSRRVVEMVVERVTSHATRAAARHMRHATEQARAALRDIAHRHTGDYASLVRVCTSTYSSLVPTASTLVPMVSPLVPTRCSAAVRSLLPESESCLRACANIATRTVIAKLTHWVQQQWPNHNTASITQEVENELRLLRISPSSVPTASTLGVSVVPSCVPSGVSVAPPSPLGPLSPRARVTGDDVNVISVADNIIQLKECVCVYLEGGNVPPSQICAVLTRSAQSVCAANPACRMPARCGLQQLAVELVIAVAASRPRDLTDSLLASIESLLSACFPPPSPSNDVTPNDVASSDAMTSQDCDTMTSRTSTSAEAEERAPTPDSDGEGTGRVNFVIANTNVVNVEASPPPVAPTLPDESSIFPRILCPRTIALLTWTRHSAGHCACNGAGHCDASWIAVGRFVAKLIKKGHMKEAAFADSCLKIYRRDWPQPVIRGMSVLVHHVTSSLGATAEGQLALFVGLLADYAADDRSIMATEEDK